MQLFVIHSADLFEGPEVHWRSRGANVARQTGHLSHLSHVKPLVSLYGGTLNEFSSVDLCLFAMVIWLSCETGHLSDAEVLEVTLGIFFYLKAVASLLCLIFGCEEYFLFVPVVSVWSKKWKRLGQSCLVSISTTSLQFIALGERSVWQEACN